MSPHQMQSKSTATYQMVVYVSQSVKRLRYDYISKKIFIIDTIFIQLPSPAREERPPVLPPVWPRPLWSPWPRFRL